MNFDRNTVIGFVLLALLLFTYLFISTKNSHELEAKKQHYVDSVTLVQNHIRDSIAQNAPADTTLNRPVQPGELATRGTETFTVVENERNAENSDHVK